MADVYNDTDRVALTICVIGRNEALNLPLLVESLDPLDQLPFRVEKIFLDSASTDETLLVAGPVFDRVFSLEESTNLCAASGRYIGTRVATGDWIFYLDGDMTMRPEWVSVLERVCSSQAGTVGWVGRRRNRYGNGTTSEHSDLHRESDGRVLQFGGASLLPRRCVLDAGNWNPGIFSNEELELYSRMQDRGYHVSFVDVGMIDHHTERLSRWRVLLGLFVLTPASGKKFYGFGQILNARVRSRSLLGFVRASPLLFGYWAGLLVAVALAAIGAWIIAVLVLFAASGIVWLKRGAKFVVIYVGLFVQAIVGFRHYDPDFDPRQREVR